MVEEGSQIVSFISSNQKAAKKDLCSKSFVIVIGAESVDSKQSSMNDAW
jgi:hypothetical protein